MDEDNTFSFLPHVRYYMKLNIQHDGRGLMYSRFASFHEFNGNFNCRKKRVTNNLRVQKFPLSSWNSD